MSSSSSDSTDSESTETQRVLLHQRYTWTSISQGLLKLKSLCRFSKPVYLILTWTLIVGTIYAGILFIAAGFVAASAALRSNIFINDSLYISPLSIRQAVLALNAILYPLSGFLADVWCGRFKTVMVGLFCLLFSTIVSVVILVWFIKGYSHDMFAFDNHYSNLVRLYIIGVCLCPFVLVGLAAYYANFIQLGLDQLMEESSMHLSLFAHWAIWMNVLGTAIVQGSALWLYVL